MYVIGDVLWVSLIFLLKHITEQKLRARIAHTQLTKLNRAKAGYASTMRIFLIVNACTIPMVLSKELLGIPYPCYIREEALVYMFVYVS